MHHLCQSEEAPRTRRLNFVDFSSEIFDEGVAEVAWKRPGLFTQNFETLIESFDDAVLKERACLEYFLDVRIVGYLADFVVENRRSFRPFSNVAQQDEKHLFCVFCWHGLLLVRNWLVAKAYWHIALQKTVRRYRLPSPFEALLLGNAHVTLPL